MFEKVGLIKKSRPNDLRKSLKWKDYTIGDALDINLRWRWLQKTFIEKGPRGLLTVFFEPDMCDQIILSLMDFKGVN